MRATQSRKEVYVERRVNGALGVIARLAIAMSILSVMAFTSLTPLAKAAGGTNYYDQGVAATRAGNYTAAAHDFELALLNGHNDPNTFYQLGLTYRKTHQLNYAVWAIASALTDPVFSGLNPQAQKDLAEAQTAGGSDDGAPPSLRNVLVKPMKAPPPTDPQVASLDSAKAFSLLQQPTQAFFASSSYLQALNAAGQGMLTQTAADLQNQSNTTAKFIFLPATPAPYSSLTTYASDFRQRLGVAQSVIVVVTPGGVAASSNRLDDATSASLAAGKHSQAGTQGPVALAVAVARAVVQRADDNASEATKRSVITGSAVGLVVLLLLAFAILRVARRERAPHHAALRAHTRLTSRTRSR
jgi:hypothetical protein